MATKVARLNVKRAPGYFYFIKDTSVYRQRAGKSAPKKHEKVATFKHERDNAYMYFLDKNGDVSRAERKSGKKRVKKVVKSGVKSVGKSVAKKVVKSVVKPVSKKATVKKVAKAKSPGKRRDAKKSVVKVPVSKKKVTRNKSVGANKALKELRLLTRGLK